MRQLLLVVSVVVLSLTACGRRKVADADVSTMPPRVTVLAATHPDAEVRAAVAKALQSKGWTTEAETNGVTTARLEHKGALVRVSITAAPDRVTIQVLEVDGAGKNLERWLNNIEANIRDNWYVAPPPAEATPQPKVAPSPTTALFERAQKTEAVRGALQRALNQHHWVIETEDETGMVARLNHRKGMVRIRLFGDTTKVTITYIDSQELPFDAAGRNDEYEKWMRNLVDAIRNNTN